MRRRRCVPLEPGGDAERVDTVRERSERRRGRVTRGTRGGGGGARRYPAKVAKARARPRDGGDRGRRVGGDGERACAGRLQEGVQSPERSHTHRSLSAATRNRLWIILGRASELEKKAVTKYGFLSLRHNAGTRDGRGVAEATAMAAGGLDEATRAHAVHASACEPAAGRDARRGRRFGR